MDTPLIEFKDVTKRFGPQTVLERVNLQIYEGEVTTIIGLSGSGKSVLYEHEPACPILWKMKNRHVDRVSHLESPISPNHKRQQRDNPHDQQPPTGDVMKQG